MYVDILPSPHLLSWVFPLPTWTVRIPYRDSLGSLSSWKVSLITPNYFFPLLFCLIELVWGQIFFHKQVQFKFWQPHEYCFKQLWKSVLGLLICCIFEAADNFGGGITSEGDCHCQETLNLPLFHYQLPYNEISLKWHENYIKSIITS